MKLDNQVMPKELGLVPLFNFGVITYDLYRSGQPYYPYQYAWLESTLKIGTIVNLRSESRHDDMLIDSLKLGMDVLNIDVQDHHPPTLEQAIQFGRMIRRRSFPMLIHCEHGHGRTSTFSCLAKMALGCTAEQAIEDEHERFHYQFKHYAQEEWLLNLDIEKLKGGPYVAS